MSQWISAVSRPKVTESSLTCRLTLVFLFVDATFRYGDMRCRVRKSREKWSKIWCFLRPTFGREGPQVFWGTFVDQHHFRPTGQVWLRFHGWSFIYSDEIKKRNYSCEILMALHSAAIIIKQLFAYLRVCGSAVAWRRVRLNWSSTELSLHWRALAADC